MSESDTRGGIDGTDDEPSLRILRVATDAYPEVLGGGALHVHEMSRLQVEMGHDVTVFTSDHGDDDLPREAERDGYTVRRFREWARPVENSLTPGMYRAIWNARDEYDIVHAHSHLYFSSNVTAALARLDDTPLVLTNHGLHSQTAPDWVQEAYLRTVGRFTFEGADRILCYTETDADRLRDRGVDTPVSVIHNGIDCDTFTPDAGDGRDCRILFVGRLIEAKGVYRLLEAFAGLADDHPEATLTFVGTGPAENDLREQSRAYSIADRVKLRGRVPNEELPRVYAESAVFALPSDAEGLPRTVLESLACGTPVVTSDLPQLESLVEGVGRTVPDGAAGPLETALRDLLGDEERRREFGERGRELVAGNYSWTETVRETTRVYHDLLGAQP